MDTSEEFDLLDFPTGRFVAWNLARKVVAFALTYSANSPVATVVAMDEELDGVVSSDLIYHVTTLSDWTHAQLHKQYDRSTKGKSIDQVGFIHASTALQLEEIKNKLYGDSPEKLVVLVLSQSKLQRAGIDVRFEDGGEGEFYPHIYAPIPVRLIEDTIYL